MRFWSASFWLAADYDLHWRTNGRSIRTAVVSFPKDVFVPGEVTRIVEGHVDGEQRVLMNEKLAHLHDWFFDNTMREARSGARLVAWPEQSLLVFKEDEPAFFERAQRLAADERIYLAMGIAAIRVGVTRPLENKVVLIDPAGKIAYSYLKSRPAAPEAAFMVRGDDPVACSTLSMSNSSQAWGTGISSGQESWPKQDCAACESGHKAKLFAPFSASVWR
jgi:hypothetical protein